MKLILTVFLVIAGFFAQAETNYEIKTSEGSFKIKTYDDRAEESSKNFKKYVEDKFYDGTIFHRVIPGFMVQGGGMTPDMTEKKTRPPIKNEAKNKVKNTRGTLAMARTGIVDSATSQFFVNLVDNEFLDHKSENQYGYAVFGEVTSGMDVIDKIAKLKTEDKSGHQNVPKKPVIIQSIKKVDSSNSDDSKPAKEEKKKKDSKKSN